MQYYVEKHLEKAIVDYDVQNGAACIVMNAKTGAILANANYPNYDPNNFLALSSQQLDLLSLIEDEDEYKKAYADAQFRQWRNRSFSDTYEPGSVFKIITLAMAVEERAATLDRTYYCSGTMDTILARKEPLRCWRIYGHGTQTLGEAMQNSCNVATATIGIKVGAQNFYKYARAFGLFDKTKVDETAEARSQWWDEKTFFDRTNQTQLTSASFGQTFKVTPIQMITAAAAAVNGGYLMQPYIVKQITDSSGAIIKATEPTVVRQVISEETSAAVRSILEDVVKSGTGKNAQVMGYRVGGKTGTSENIEQLSQSGLTDGTPKDYIVSFLGFAPVDDPEIIVLLLMDTPSESTGITVSGGAMAAPVVSSMLEDLLPLCFEIKPQYTEEELQNINLNVPRLTGKSVADAKALLGSLGFRGVVVGDGDTVTGQLPAPNAYVTSGTRVLVYAGQGTPKLTAVVPDLSGMAYVAAKQALEGDGMFIRTSGALKTDSKAKVSVQSIAPGVEVVYGTVVEVTLIDKDAVETRN
jgi:stage V sporulation protein D (sporulation-specific penicillin-binding protein)